MDRNTIRSCLGRVAARGGAELKSKEPHWGDAILCDGLVYATRALSLDEPAEDAVKWLRPKLAKGPDTSGWIWLWAAEALPALDLYLLTSDHAYLEYARAILTALESRTARTADDAILPHPPAREVWIDMVYFSAPAMARLGRLSGDPAMMERALDQLLLHRNHLLDDSTGLFWHVAYVDERRHSPCRWARGNSWFSVAAPEVIGEVRLAGLEHRLAAKTADVGATLTRQLNAVVAVQAPDGLWHTVIDRPDSYLESAASAGFTLGLGRALKMGLEGLERTSVESAYRRGVDAICRKTTAAGEFTGVSQQTPPGDFNFYNSIEVGTAPFGTGLCLMALAEALASA